MNANRINSLDFINQAEVGYKRGFENGSLYATIFYAKTIEEGGFEATTNTIIENDLCALAFVRFVYVLVNQGELYSPGNKK